MSDTDKISSPHDPPFIRYTNEDPHDDSKITPGCPKITPNKIQFIKNLPKIYIVFDPKSSIILYSNTQRLRM